MRIVKWDKVASSSLEKIYDYIMQDSVQNANNILDEIAMKIEELIKCPEKHSLDKYKRRNDGNFRAFEIYHIRIGYYVDDKVIRIVRIRSTHQEPLDY